MDTDGDIYNRDIIARVFVDLTSKLYGGEVIKNRNSVPANPDIINHGRVQAYESKASRSYYQHKIHPTQIDLYQKFLDLSIPQNPNFKPINLPELYYFLWQYDCNEGISKIERGKAKNEIIRNINGLLVLSFDLIKEMKEFLGTKYYNGGWGEVCILKASQRRQFMESPELSLVAMGLNKDNFSISTEGIKSGEYKYKCMNLPSFNITTIQNKNLRGVKRIKRRK